jgi:hypothetical protein
MLRWQAERAREATVDYLARYVAERPAADSFNAHTMQKFAANLGHDLDAVRNALRRPWSNGQTEGQIHRLKTQARHVWAGERYFAACPDASAPRGRESPSVSQNRENADFHTVRQRRGVGMLLHYRLSIVYQPI